LIIRHFGYFDRSMIAFIILIHFFLFIINIDLLDGDLPLYQMMLSGVTLNVSEFKPGLFLFSFLMQYMNTAVVLYFVVCAIYLGICHQLLKFAFCSNDHPGLNIYLVLLSSMTSFVTLAFSQTILAQGIACFFCLVALNQRSHFSTTIFLIIAISFHPLYLVFCPAFLFWRFIGSQGFSQHCLILFLVGTILVGVIMISVSSGFESNQNIEMLITGSLGLILYSYLFARADIFFLLILLVNSIFLSMFFITDNYDRFFLALWAFIPVIFSDHRLIGRLNINAVAAFVFICASVFYSPAKYWF
jgi:hypothetical protein